MAFKDTIANIKPKITPPNLSNIKIDSISVDNITNIFKPYLTNLFTGIFNTDSLLNETIKQSSELLNRKGRLEIINGTTINFYPFVDGPWLQVKIQFDRKLSIIKNNIQNLQKIVDILNKTLKIINTILTTLNILLSITKKTLNAQLVAAGSDLAASPSPNKPVAGPVLASLQAQLQTINDVQDKIKEINKIITIIINMLQIGNSYLTKIKIKLNQVSFNIILNSSNYNETKTELETTKYNISIVPLKDGFNKAIAKDSLSGLLIAQTAPSIVKTPLELINELKQILS
jgi:hypothetical protein